jgi:hypothetical protein
MPLSQNNCTLGRQSDGFCAQSGLSWHVLDDFNDARISPRQWDETVAATNGNFYMTFQWCRAWWRFYGAGRQLRILIFFRGEELAAILPTFLEKLWIGPVWVKMARLAGADSTTQLCNPPVHKDLAASVLQTAAGYFIGQCGCDAVIFSPVSADFPGFDEICLACRQLPPATYGTQVRQTGIHSVFRLSASFEDYLKGLGKSQRANYKRDWNLLNKSFSVAVDSIFEESQLAGEFDAFSKMHKAQWNAEGRQGVFADWPASYEFNLELIKACASQRRVFFHRLVLDGEAVSYQFCFTFQGRLCWRWTARVVGGNWQRYGLGRMGLAKLIEAAIGQGIHSIEGGTGHYDYKVQMGASEVPFYSFAIASRRRGAGGRLRLMKLFSQVLDIAYYKILFRRVYPRVPALRRPLARLWIRSRF